MTHFFKRHLTEGSICSEIDGLLLQSIFNCGSAVGVWSLETAFLALPVLLREGH